MLVAWRDGGVLSNYFLALRVLPSFKILNNPKVLAYLKMELGPSPFQIINIAIMVYFSLGYYFKLSLYMLDSFLCKLDLFLFHFLLLLFLCIDFGTRMRLDYGRR